MEQQQKHIEPKSRIIILLQKDTVRALSGLLYSYLSYIAFPQEQCHIASQSNVLEVALSIEPSLSLLGDKYWVHTAHGILDIFLDIP